MKTGWQKKTIGDCCVVIAGQSPDGKFYNSDGNGLPFYQGKKDFGEKFIETPSTWTTDVTKRAYKGDILMSVRAPVGPVNFATDEICIGRGLAALRCRQEIDPEFLFYELLHLQPIISGKSGAVFASINKTEIENLQIVYPALNEQKRIVGILDEAFEGIAAAKANAEKNLQNARDVFSKYLESLFAGGGVSWPKKRLADVSLEFGRGRSKHRPRNDPNLYGGRYAFIQTGDLNNADHWLTNYTQTYNDFGLAQSKLWPKGTVCIALVGATVGETAILGMEACFPDSVIGIVPGPAFADSEYLEYLLQSYKAVLKEKGKGTARDNINLGIFEDQAFPFPPVEKQKEVANVLNGIKAETRKLEALYSSKLAALDELKKSLLHKAFAGEL